MYLGQEDVCDTGLALGLGSGGRSAPPIHNNLRQDPASSMSNPATAKPSLTLSLSDDRPPPAATGKMEGNKFAEEARSSPRSTVSSFSTACPCPSSVKRERDMAAEEEMERASSRASDDEDEGSARKKLRLTKEQSALLEERFKEHSTLNPKQKQALAKQLNLRPRQVEVWFQNRRARTKLKQTEVDCEFLKRCCETLTNENRRLQKELHELRALKFSAPPLYMQLPAATLTMCPSCERIIGGGSAASKGGGGGGGGGALMVAPKAHFFNPFTHPAAC